MIEELPESHSTPELQLKLMKNQKLNIVDEMTTF
jgi:hypothetical protein